MERTRFEPSEIVVRDRVRSTVSEDAVARLMTSMEKIGLQVPISVILEADDVILVAGRHRLETARRLNWMLVDCVLHTDAQQARMWEIAENLHRAELTALERDEHIAEWVRLADISGQPVPKLGRHPGGVKAASREIGVNAKDAQRATKVDSLSAPAKQAARDTGLADNRTALLKAAAEPVERQEAAIRNYQPSASKPAPAIKNAFESEEDWRRALFTVWNRGAQDWRDRAMETFDSPVFDRTQAA